MKLSRQNFKPLYFGRLNDLFDHFDMQFSLDHDLGTTPKFPLKYDHQLPLLVYQKDQSKQYFGMQMRPHNLPRIFFAEFMMLTNLIFYDYYLD